MPGQRWRPGISHFFLKKINAFAGHNNSAHFSFSKRESFAIGISGFRLSKH